MGCCHGRRPLGVRALFTGGECQPDRPRGGTSCCCLRSLTARQGGLVYPLHENEKKGAGRAAGSSTSRSVERRPASEIPRGAGSTSSTGSDSDESAPFSADEAHRCCWSRRSLGAVAARHLRRRWSARRSRGAARHDLPIPARLRLAGPASPRTRTARLASGPSTWDTRPSPRDVRLPA